MTLKEAMNRIEELERKVKELEARQQHLHFYSAPYQVYIPVQPILPMPCQPWPIGPTWMSGTGAVGAAAGGATTNLLTFNA